MNKTPKIDREPALDVLIWIRAETVTRVHIKHNIDKRTFGKKVEYSHLTNEPIRKHGSSFSERYIA